MTILCLSSPAEEEHLDEVSLLGLEVPRGWYRADGCLEVRIEGMANPQGLYALLGVSQTASKAEITKAYHRRALLVHPDKNQTPEATEKFQAVGSSTFVRGELRQLNNV